MKALLDVLRRSLSRVLAAPLAAATAFLSVPEGMAAEFQTAVVTAATVALYGLFHRLLEAFGVSDD